MLYFIATPIGNLKEITYRAVEVLKSVDCVYAEDTRRSAVLLNEYGIHKPLFSYRKFNERARSAEIIEKLKDGKDVAVISDAGTPLISDPGAVIAQELIAEDLEYTLVSGPCACINAVVLSGLDASAFYMAGFLPEKNKDKNALTDQLKDLPATLVFYSPPHDVQKDLDFLYSAFGERRVAVVREISKKFETVHRGVLGGDLNLTLKGEMVIVVEGAERSKDKYSDLTVKERLKMLIGEGIEKKEAVKTVAKEKGLSKSEIYRESLDLQ